MIDTKTTSITDANGIVSAPIRVGDLLTTYEPSPISDEVASDVSTAPTADSTRGSGSPWLDAGTAQVRGAEQEWCDLCAYDETCEPGMPRDVVDHSIEPDTTWDDGWGQGPRYEVWYLACGHTLAQFC